MVFSISGYLVFFRPIGVYASKESVEMQDDRKMKEGSHFFLDNEPRLLTFVTKLTELKKATFPQP
jgi:hypothetical protein